jgi:hypothetical protein
MHKCNRTLLISLSCFLYIFVQYVIGYGGGLLAQDNPVIKCALEPGTTVVSCYCTTHAIGNALHCSYLAKSLLRVAGTDYSGIYKSVQETQLNRKLVCCSAQ